jgi:hypothetical protein
MLVYLHVKVTPSVLIDTLVFPGTHPEECEFAVGIAVEQTLPKKPVVVVDPEARVRSRWQNAFEFVTECVVDVLISV